MQSDVAGFGMVTLPATSALRQDAALARAVASPAVLQ